MIFDYFKFRKYRKQLKGMRNAISRKLISDDDIITDAERSSLQKLLEQANGLDYRNADAVEKFLSASQAGLDSCTHISTAKLKLRNALDVLAVAFAVAFGIRGLFLQPFKIPTSSMQPTLFGIHYVDRKGLAEHCGPIANLMIPLFSPKAKLTIRSDGEFTGYRHRPKYLIDTETLLQIGSETYALPGTIGNTAAYIDLGRESFRKGETLCDGWLSTGDHLFVDRFSLHFLPLKRGEVIVFTTEGIKSPTQPLSGFYYIKRLVGIPGDTLKIEDNILYIKPEGASEFKPATAFSDRFKRLYSFEGGYQGHSASELLAPDTELKVPKNMYFALGDNTGNSLDGRNWGFIPRKNMIGRALNVFWPISRRWGFVDTKDHLKGKTVLPGSMSWQ